MPADLETIVEQEQAEYDADRDLDGAVVSGIVSGEDADNGQLFEVPRVKVAVDETDPTVLKVSFSGTVELARGHARDVDFYNRLRAGKPADLSISVHVAGAQRTHRRDKDGDVDAVVETKNLIVTNIDVADTDAE